MVSRILYLPSLDHYIDISRVPDKVNFGDVVDQFAQDRGRLALVWEDESGRKAQYSFWDMKILSNQWGNLLKNLGVQRGDRILVMLPPIPEWHVATVGTMKIGAIVIPCPEMLRGKDLIYRANHSEAKVLVASEESWEAAESARQQCPSLQHCVLVGGQHPGWIHYESEIGKNSRHLQVAETGGGDPALIYYTSGTTGGPKAAVHSHASIHSNFIPARSA